MAGVQPEPAVKSATKHCVAFLATVFFLYCCSIFNTFAVEKALHARPPNPVREYAYGVIRTPYSAIQKCPSSSAIYGYLCAEYPKLHLLGMYDKFY